MAGRLRAWLREARGASVLVACAASRCCCSRAMACLSLPCYCCPVTLTALKVFHRARRRLSLLVSIHLRRSATEAPRRDACRAHGRAHRAAAGTLQDAQWELSENETRYRALLDTQDEAIVAATRGQPDVRQQGVPRHVRCRGTTCSASRSPSMYVRRRHRAARRHRRNSPSTLRAARRYRRRPALDRMGGAARRGAGRRRLRGAERRPRRHRAAPRRSAAGRGARPGGGGQPRQERASSPP